MENGRRAGYRLDKRMSGDISGIEGFGGMTFLGIEDDQPARPLRLGRQGTILRQGYGLAGE
jgi:hypothetical protein